MHVSTPNTNPEPSFVRQTACLNPTHKHYGFMGQTCMAPARGQVHVVAENLNINPKHRFMGQTCMSSKGPGLFCHQKTLHINPKHSFMGQTCMSPARGQVHVVTRNTDQGVVCHIVAYFGTQLTVLQACQLSHLWTPAHLSNH